MSSERGLILKKAHKLINGDRNDDYGEFGDNVESMRNLMKGMCNLDLSDHQVHCFFLALKLCRANGKSFTKDTLTDLAGYAGLIDDSQHHKLSEQAEEEITRLRNQGFKNTLHGENS